MIFDSLYVTQKVHHILIFLSKSLPLICENHHRNQTILLNIYLTHLPLNRP